MADLLLCKGCKAKHVMLDCWGEPRELCESCLDLKADKRDKYRDVPERALSDEVES